MAGISAFRSDAARAAWFSSTSWIPLLPTLTAGHRVVLIDAIADVNKSVATAPITTAAHIVTWLRRDAARPRRRGKNACARTRGDQSSGSASPGSSGSHRGRRRAPDPVGLQPISGKFPILVVLGKQETHHDGPSVAARFRHRLPAARVEVVEQLLTDFLH